MNISKNKKLSSRIAIVIGSTLFGLFIFGALILFLFNSSRNKEFVQNILDEQIDLVLNNLEDYRIRSQYQVLGRAIYRLNLVDAVAVFDKECEILNKIPLNRDFPNICKSKVDSRFYVKLFDDQVSKISGIAVIPRYSSYGFGIKEYIYFLLFFLMSFLFILYISNILINRVFKEPFDKIIQSILNLIDHQNVSADPIGKSDIPQELRPMYDAVIETNEKLNKARKDLIKTQQLEADKRFGKILVHNIKTPINFLYKNIIPLKDNPNIDSELKENLMGLASQVMQITDNLGQHFLKTAKSDDQDLVDDYISFYVEKCFNEYVSTHKLEGTIDFKLSFEEDVYTESCAYNKAELKTILFNLFNNACEALSEVDNRKIEVTGSKINGHLLFCIIDNGPGVPTEVLPYIFEEGRTTKESGNGIGLFHAREQLESWGGLLRAKNLDRQGACFYFSLPITFSSENFNIVEESRIAPLIILIEDDQLVSLNWKMAAKKAGLQERFEVFSSPELCEEYICSNDHISKQTFFFIDSHFDNSDWEGGEYALSLFERGHKQLVISSSFDESEFKKLFWIRGIISDKMAPHWT